MDKTICVWALPILWVEGECWTCVCVWVAVVGNGDGAWNSLEEWGGVMSVVSFDFCVDGRSRYFHIGVGRYLHILGAPSLQSC